jgi:hypothetical protein
MLSVRVEITGDKKALKQLQNSIKAFEDWKPELSAVGDYLVDFYKDPVFETEGGIIGERWQELSQPYKARKATKYPGRGILEATGTLRKSYRKRVYSNLLQVINPVPYSQYHQEGRGVPERVLIKVDDARRNEIVDIFKKGALIKLQKALR